MQWVYAYPQTAPTDLLLFPLLPQTPLLFPQALVLESLVAPLDGLDAEEVDRSLPAVLRLSFANSPWLRGECDGVPDRLLNAGLLACAGRVPIGATPGLMVLPGRGGDPPGEDVDVRLDC